MRGTGAIVGCFVVFILAGSIIKGEDAAETKPRQWDFDKEKAGEIAAGFSTEGGDWKVVADDTAPSKGQVLAQVASSENAAFNLVLIKDAKAKHLDLSVKFRSVEGKTDQGGGLVWRARDAKNYYLCRYNPLEENIRLYKVVDGQRTVIESLDVASTPGWHSLRVTMRDDRITYFFDDEARGYIVNDFFMESGMIGLWTKADARTRFDDLAFIPFS